MPIFIYGHNNNIIIIIYIAHTRVRVRAKFTAFPAHDGHYQRKISILPANSSKTLPLSREKVVTLHTDSVSYGFYRKYDEQLKAIKDYMDKIENYLNDLNAEVQILISEERLLPVPAFTQYVTDGIAEKTGVDEHYAVHCLMTDKMNRVLGEIHGYGISANKEVLTLYYSVYEPTLKREQPSQRMILTVASTACRVSMTSVSEELISV